MYKVMGYERDRYTDGYRVYNDTKGFYDGKIADFDGQCEVTRHEAQDLADLLNKGELLESLLHQITKE